MKYPLVLLVLAGLGLQGCDSVDPNSPLGKRQALFKEMLRTSEDLGGMLRGRLPFDEQAFAQALGDMRGIHRYGSFYLPMDEALILCAVDLSGRCTLNWDVHCSTEKVGDFDVECAKEFWLGFARSVPATVHFVQFAGENTHHILEACFKGAGHALGAAVKIDEAHKDEIPSTKGLLV